MKTPKVSFMKDRKNLTRVFGVILIVALLIAGAMFWPEKAKPEPKYSPTVDLPGDYMVFVDAPGDEEDMMFIAMLSSVVMTDVYHDMWILTPEGELAPHSLWTFEHLKNNDVTALVFTDDDSVPEKLKGQGVNVVDEFVFPKDGDVLTQFTGYDDWLPVASYEEALWASSLAHVDNKVMMASKKPTFKSQEEVWAELSDRGVMANYTVVTHPYDFEVERFNMTEQKWHIPSLSAVAAEVAAYHDAYVITQWEENTTTIAQYDPLQNANATGIYYELKALNETYGPIEYIALVGSAVSVPQFILPDRASNEPDGVSCDVYYGFLDDDKYVMDAAVGRLVNLDVQAMAMQMVRTYSYDDFSDTVEVDFSQSGGGTQTINWRTHGSVWNGFEVADQRIQMTPGWFMKDDFQDEGWTYDYVRTTGNEGVREIGTGKEILIRPIMESSNLVTYRGHGSWHATFYVYEPDNPDHLKGRLEGYDDTTSSPSVRDFNIPPQVSVLVACENAKIWGLHWGAGEVDIETSYPLNYFYAGAVGLIAATEVSYSNIGQDFYSLPEETRLPGLIIKDGDHEWDLNNAWYAFSVDGLVDHEEEHGEIGKAHMWAENRYIAYHNNEFSPFDSGTDAHWKEIVMYVCYGDPAFKMSPTNPGANSYDPWHNGADDM
jgi:hypothetical protein